MGWCNKDHWSYVFLALTHRYLLVLTPLPACPRTPCGFCSQPRRSSEQSSCSPITTQTRTGSCTSPMSAMPTDNGGLRSGIFWERTRRIGKWQDDAMMIWKRLPHYWSFVREIHHPMVDPHTKGQLCRLLVFICCWPNRLLNQSSSC